MSKPLSSDPGLPRPGAKETPFDSVLTRALLGYFADLAYILNEETPKLGDENVFTAEQEIDIEDAVNNAVTYGLIMAHETTGSPANGIGVGLGFAVETTANNIESIAALEAVVTDVTAASEDGDLVVKTMVAGTLAEIARFSRTATARDTGLKLWDVDNGTVERVTVGVADSGGVGFKLLRIPN